MKHLADLRLDFPVLHQKINNYPLIYFDNAATAQVPYAVIDAMTSFYTEYKSNVDRGLYSFAEKTTQAYEDARKKVANFIHALPEEIIFTSGATHSINMVARIWAEHHVQAGDEIIISQVEHHSNFLPWQQLALEKNVTLTVIPIDETGRLDMRIYCAAVSSKTKLVAIVHTSNILGTTNDIESIVTVAHQYGAKVLVDAAQSIAHHSIDVAQLGADFLVFSGHKLFGPTGVGCLFIKKNIQNECKPYIFGGSMVYSASYQESFWKNPPYCFEAGTPPIAQALGLAVAIDYLEKNIDFKKSYEHECALAAMAAQGLQDLGFHVLVSKGLGHMVTFYDDEIHAHDIASYLNSYGIAVRAGNHCVQPFHEKHAIESTVRLSFAFYNTMSEVQFFLDMIKQL